MTEQEQKAFDQMRGALEQALRGMSAAIFGTDTYKVSSRGDFASRVEKQIQEALTAANAVSEQPNVVQVMALNVVLDPTMAPNEMKLVQPQAQGEAVFYYAENVDGKQHDTGRVYVRTPGKKHDNFFADCCSFEDARKIAAALNAYAHPQATEPAGWKLVPVEPTQEMCNAARWSEYGEETSRQYEVSNEFIQSVWASLLAAAPEAHHG